MAADLAVIRSSAAGSQAEGREAGKLETRALGTFVAVELFCETLENDVTCTVQYGTR